MKSIENHEASGENGMVLHSVILREEQSIVKIDSPLNNILVISGINIFLHVWIYMKQIQLIGGQS